MKAISFDPRLLILDEATASLDSRQVKRLFELVKKWKEEGRRLFSYRTAWKKFSASPIVFGACEMAKRLDAGSMKDVTERDLVELMVEKALGLQQCQARPAEADAKPS